LFDLTVWIDVPLDVVEQRIVDRWESASLDAAEIVRRTEENDLPNARHVVLGSVSADLRIVNYGAGPTPGE
jgi:pantothenate kinase